MASQKSPSIRDMPAEMVVNILRQLDTIQQLKTVASSHRIFHDAFRNNVQSTVRSIIKKEIQQDILPFALALLEASRSDPEDAEAVPRVMKNLKDRVSNPTLASEKLATLRILDIFFMSRTHRAVVSLCEKFCRASLPLYDKWLGSSTACEAGTRDRFRIHRALYRYQIMCDLLCQPSGHRNGKEDVIEAERQEALLSFSPWVNEQLVCIYFFLQRTVLEAYDDVASHDISWGEVPVHWLDDPWWENPLEHRVQDFLVSGLEFLNLIAEAITFEQRVALFDKAIDERHAASKPSVTSQQGISPFSHMYCVSDYSKQSFDQEVDVETLFARAYRIGVIEPLASSIDRPDETIKSVSARTWLKAQWDKELHLSVNDFYADANLWMCGYVMWEATSQIPLDVFKQKVSAIREEPHFFQRLRSSFGNETISRSERMRTDLYMAGAKGYWPLEGIDFSRVHGLKEERKQRLLEEWGEWEASNIETQKSDAPIAMETAVACGEGDVQAEA